jgi:hypothetical protein
MSASGQIRSPQVYPEVLLGTSGDPQIPDAITAAATHASSVPISPPEHLQQRMWTEYQLLDQLIGAGEQQGRHREP